jgi:hypothetical protein
LNSVVVIDDVIVAVAVFEVMVGIVVVATVVADDDDDVVAAVDVIVMIDFVAIDYFAVAVGLANVDFASTCLRIFFLYFPIYTKQKLFSKIHFIKTVEKTTFENLAQKLISLKL